MMIFALLVQCLQDPMTKRFVALGLLLLVFVGIAIYSNSDPE
jgi:hypothetical protein